MPRLAQGKGRMPYSLGGEVGSLFANLKYGSRQKEIS